MSHPRPGAVTGVGRVALGIAAQQVPVATIPRVIRHLAQVAIEQRHCAVRFDHAIQQVQRRGAVHPMERPPHRHQPKRPKRRRQVERTSLHEPNVRRAAIRRFGDTQHLRLGIDRHHLAHQRGERTRQHAGPAAQIQQPVARSQPSQFRHPAYQPRRIGRPSCQIMPRGRAKTVRLKNCCIRHDLFTSRPQCATIHVLGSHS